MFLEWFPLFFLYSIGFILGLIPPFLWGLFGGDEPLIEEHPNLTGFLKLVHHWQIGVAIVICGLIEWMFFPQNTPLEIIIFGWGTGTTIDDILFHSFEHYFKRKVNGKI